MVRPDQKREAAQVMIKKGLPITKACRLVKLPRSSFYLEPTPIDTTSVQIVQSIAERYQKLGYRMLHTLHRNEEEQWIIRNSLGFIMNKPSLKKAET